MKTDIEKLLKSICDFFKKDIHNNVYAMLVYGSGKIKSDTDIFIVNADSSELYNLILGQLDIAVLGKSVFENMVTNADIIATEPLLTGRIYYQKSNYIINLKKNLKIVNKDVFSYLLNQSLCSYRNALYYLNAESHKAHNQLLNSLVNLSYAWSYLLVAKQYKVKMKEGIHGLLTLNEIEDLPDSKHLNNTRSMIRTYKINPMSVASDMVEQEIQEYELYLACTQ